ncbi:hypothetical protein JW851_00880 [Candidatus Woesearchaeota archaeon]|nr:hypothetical protein [Candidatus Woesearchaeota archaeon]
MAQKYRLVIRQEGKGFGYSVKKALAAQRSFDHTPVINVHLVESVSDSSSFEVTLEDSVSEIAAKGVIESVLGKSGQIPKEADFSIESIELLKDDPDMASVPAQDKSNLFEQINLLKSQLKFKEKELEESRQEILLAQRRLEESKYVDIEDPVLGILSYFATREFSFGRLIEKELDSAFAIRVLRGEINDNIPSYIRHMEGTKKTDSEIEEILNSDPARIQKNKEELEKHSSKLLEEKKALDLILSGELGLPDSFKNAILEITKSKNYDKEIENKSKEICYFDEIEKSHARFIKHKKNYSVLKEHIDIIQESSEDIPILFKREEKNLLHIYMPISARSITSVISNELLDGVAKIVNQISLSQNISGKVDLLPHDRFLAFRVDFPETSTNTIKIFREISEKIIDEVPISLKLSGYKSFVPYRVGI